MFIKLLLFSVEHKNEHLSEQFTKLLQYHEKHTLKSNMQNIYSNSNNKLLKYVKLWFFIITLCTQSPDIFKERLKGFCTFNFFFENLSFDFVTTE